jgi:hypothetical protein
MRVGLQIKQEPETSCGIMFDEAMSFEGYTQLESTNLELGLKKKLV